MSYLINTNMILIYDSYRNQDKATLGLTYKRMTQRGQLITACVLEVKFKFSDVKLINQQLYWYLPFRSKV